VAAGDFNAHSPLWDSRGRSNITGRSLEATIEALPIGLLNDGSFPTYIDNRCGTTSCLDLVILTPNLFTRASLTQGLDLGSDHFPVCCKIGTRLVRSSESVPVRWKFYQANWTLYCQALDDALISPEYGPRDADSGCTYLSNAVLKAASRSVSQS
jgi:hypothetical protein